jgi:hypothetical protein
VADRTLRPSDLDPRTLRWVAKRLRQQSSEWWQDGAEYRSAHPSADDNEHDYGHGMTAAASDLDMLIGSIGDIADQHASRQRLRRRSNTEVPRG